MMGGTIRTRRLELVPMTLEFVEAVLELRRTDAEAALAVRLTDAWPTGAESWLEARRDALRADAGSGCWASRAVVLYDRTLIGRAGFHARPNAEGEAELGYEIDPAFRRTGYASEAVRAVLDWGFSHAELRVAVACMRADNDASANVARKTGFTFARIVHDERHGERMRFERTRSPGIAG